MKARIIIADDHKILREGLRAVIEASPAYEVVAEAVNGRHAVKMAGEFDPDVILMDVSMPDLNGIDATKQILDINDGIKIIALSMYSDRQFIRGMFSAGAYGYLLKDCDSEELLKAIDSVIANRKFISDKISEVVISELVDYENNTDKTLLSSREREILQLIAEGFSAKEIGDKLFLSSKTVDVHRKNIMVKLDIHSIPELTKYAIRKGLTGLDE